VTSSPLFISMCISLVVLGFKLRSVESLLSHQRELAMVSKEKEELQLESLKTVTTNQDKGNTTATNGDENEMDMGQAIMDVVDFVA
jgi:hypothetical protein